MFASYFEREYELAVRDFCHLTLRYIPSAPDDVAARIRIPTEALPAAFDFHVGKPLNRPEAGDVRNIAAPISQPSQLRQLRDLIDTALTELEVPLPNEELRPFIMLADAVTRTPRDAYFGHASPRPPIRTTCRLDEFHLFQSVRTDRGHRYNRLRTWRLREA